MLSEAAPCSTLMLCQSCWPGRQAGVPQVTSRSLHQVRLDRTLKLRLLGPALDAVC